MILRSFRGAAGGSKFGLICAFAANVRSSSTTVGSALVGQVVTCSGRGGCVLPFQNDPPRACAAAGFP